MPGLLPDRYIGSGARVYLDDDGIIFDASLNQTNIGGNNNKVGSWALRHSVVGSSLNAPLQFYKLQLLDQDGDFMVHTRWGRVGEFGQVKTLGPFDVDDALKEYNKKFKDKSGYKWEDRSQPAKKGKYTFLERNYEDDGDNDEETVKKEEDDEDDDATPKIASKLPIQTQRLVELIFNQNHFNAVLENIGYNANKLPLGKLSKATLKTGFEHLHELASLIKHPNLSQNKYQISQKEVLPTHTVSLICIVLTIDLGY